MHQALTELLTSEIVNCELDLGHDQTKLRVELYAAHGVIAETINADGSWHLSLRLSRQEYKRLLSFWPMF